ncbi:MAG: recombinase zinc beta ribbon domain-containing protein, partial [Bacilli bacterium]|nr:recombinase zinc beta ribbon domain-containing protein [Bacilli bacterium]
SFFAIITHWEENEKILDRLLENETYLGKVKYKNKTFEGTYEPIISEELFQKVQQSIKLRLNSASQTRKNPFHSTHLLTGFIKCGKCGCRMHSQTRKRINNSKWYYICYARSRSGKFYTENLPVCSAAIIDGVTLDDLIIQQIHCLKYNENYYNEIASKKEEEKPNLSQFIQKQIESIDKKLNKLVDLYLLDSFDKDELEIRRNRLVEEKNTLIKSLKKENPVQITRKDIMDALEDFESIFAGDDLAKKKNLLALLIEEIYVNEGNVEIHWTF